MKIISLDGFQSYGCVGSGSKNAKRDHFKPISTKFFSLNYAIIVLSVLSLLITIFGSLFKTLIKVYFFLVVNRLICALVISSFIRHIRNFDKSSIKVLLPLHFINQANYLGTSITALSTRIPSILFKPQMNSMNYLSVFSAFCFTSILVMEIINLVYTYDIFFKVERNFIILKSAVNNGDLKLNLCVFIIFGYCLFADCIYLLFSILTYIKYTLFHGYYTEIILSSFSGICIFISVTGLLLGVSIIHYLR
ncbi:uncharacterized protein cubi_03590x5 [Cryptosporidium ubiquitum]|uniref:Uncharacterized protein n=1 Tax=Cryptosporidium ubiquitum TaxID=857276 RepID=A0A1J4MHS3_9CRYT|nr:uncharacterized protein cubi_03590x5 [Cryptosporidium ubiquitum]OII73793.1 hypothetical protein cubi_03590x5 [Cryptosporidium ubiquitum]